MSRMAHGFAVAAVLGAILPTSVSASSYAVATNTITGFDLNFASTPAFFSDFTFTQDSAAINGTGIASAGSTDAPASCINCGYNNSFTAHGLGSAPGYAYGDTFIGNTGVIAGSGAAQGIAEASGFTGNANASSVNTMTAVFQLASNNTVSFSFSADPYLATLLGPNGLAAGANIGMGITITSGSTTVFSWYPDGNGTVGGTVGGTATSDPFSLNTGEAQGSASDNLPGYFSVASGTFGPGLYTMNITMSQSAFVQTVPVPAAAWLFGGGLIGLVGVARRKAA